MKAERRFCWQACRRAANTQKVSPDAPNALAGLRMPRKDERVTERNAMIRNLSTAGLVATVFGLTTATMAQEAVRNGAPLQFSGGSPETHIWVSPAGARDGGKLRFWLFLMPKSPQTVRYFHFVQRADKYDVNAQLFEADCSVRQQVRRMRDEYYLENFSHVGATATEQHAETLTVGPNSPVSVALGTLCGDKPAGGSAPTMAEARRKSDEHFRRTAAPGNPPPASAKPALPPASGPAAPSPKPAASKPVATTSSPEPQPWECAGAARRMLGLAEASYGLMMMHDEGVSGSGPAIAKARQRVEDEKALAMKLYPELQLTKAQADAVKAMPRPYEVRERCLAELAAAKPALQTASSGPSKPVARPANLWGRYEPGGTTPFYRLKPAQPGFYISLPEYQPTGKSGLPQVILLQALKASDGSSDSTAHIFSVDCDAKMLWRIEHRKLRDGDIVKTFAADPAATAPETPVAKGVVAATCGSGAMGGIVGSVRMMIDAGLIG